MRNFDDLWSQDWKALGKYTSQAQYGSDAWNQAHSVVEARIGYETASMAQQTAKMAYETAALAKATRSLTNVTVWLVGATVVLSLLTMIVGLVAADG